MRASNSTSIVLQQCQNKVSFQRKGSRVVLRFLLVVLSIHKKPLSTCLKNVVKVY